MGSPAESSRPVAICCPSITELCTRRFSSWSKRDTSLPSGASQTTIVKQNITNSPEQDGNNLRENRGNGNRQPQSSRVSCHRGRSLDEATTRLVFAFRRVVPQGAARLRVGGRTGKSSPDAHRGQSSLWHEPSGGAEAGAAQS